VRQRTAHYWQLFDEIPQPSVVTRADSTILEANKAAAELLNVGQRSLAGRALSVFVCEDRTGFLSRIAELVAHRSASQFDLKVRPRERAPLHVKVMARADERSLRWYFHTEPLSQTLPLESDLSSTL
jgi:PAS domain S-box-containing protein